MRKRLHCFHAVCSPVFTLLFGFFLLLNAQFHQIIPQMPPHPELLKKIKSGLIPAPSIMLKSREKEALGIDAAWSDLLLLNKARSRGKLPVREVGALSSPSGAWNLLVILTDFSDKQHHVNSSYFDSLLFSSSLHSLKKYYSEISYASIDLVTLNLPSSSGWIRAPQLYAYYISGGDNGTGTYPNNCQKLVEDIIPLVDPLVDFSKYDNDHNGEVDGIMVIHSGKGAEYTGASQDIWSHAWALRSRQYRDGVYISGYSIQPEYYADTSGDMTIGVFAHELGHSAFGLPDLYDRDYSSEGLGDWSLMSGGSWNGTTAIGGDSPSHPDAWSRCQMGFILPILCTDNARNITVSPIETAEGSIYKLSGEGDASSQEYYLAENRQKLGFDAALPGSGFLIYHIDDDKLNNDKEWYPGHVSSGHYKVSLMQADNKWDLEKGENRGDSGDPFTATSGKNKFSLITLPNSRLYTNDDSKIAVTNINEPLADFYVSTKNYSITISSPAATDNWNAYSSQDICWSAAGCTLVNLDYSTDNGASWRNIASKVAASSGKYSWTVPNYSSTSGRIKISDALYPSASIISNAFIITGQGPAAVFPLPGDIIFTQVGSSDPDRFEFITLKRLNLTNLKLTDNAILSNGTMASTEGTLDLSSTKYSSLVDVPQGTFIRFERGSSSDETDPSDRIITFYYTTEPMLAAGGDQIVAYTGSSSSPVFIAGIDFGNSGWISSGTTTSHNSFAPHTISDIYAGNKDNYRFKDSTDFNPDSTREFVKNISHWEGSNASMAFTFKSIRYNPLPVELISFSGSYQSGKIVLSWQTATEVNNYGWDIERKSPSEVYAENMQKPGWEKAGFVHGNGNSNKENSYYFTDNLLSVSGSLTYRLRQIDNDGKADSYSPEIEIAVPETKAFVLAQNYPNPFNSSTVIHYSIAERSHVTLTLYNCLGQKIATLINNEQNAGSHQHIINMSDLKSISLSSGIYYYRLEAGQNYSTKKLLLLK